MKRLMLWVIAVAVLATVGGAVFMRTLDHPPGIWHVDPAEAVRRKTANDYIVAPEGMAKSRPDRIFEARAMAPRDLLFLFDSIAKNASRTTKIAMDEETLTATYVQTSAFFAFPDYISVKAVAVGDGAGLVIWSRSRFGASDFGVNQQRIDDWLAKMGN